MTIAMIRARRFGSLGRLGLLGFEADMIAAKAYRCGAGLAKLRVNRHREGAVAAGFVGFEGVGR